VVCQPQLFSGLPSEAATEPIGSIVTILLRLLHWTEYPSHRCHYYRFSLCSYYMLLSMQERNARTCWLGLTC
jgi:hypothetical protein